MSKHSEYWSVPPSSKPVAVQRASVAAEAYAAAFREKFPSHALPTAFKSTAVKLARLLIQKKQPDVARLLTDFVHKQATPIKCDLSRFKLPKPSLHPSHTPKSS